MPDGRRRQAGIPERLGEHDDYRDHRHQTVVVRSEQARQDDGRGGL